MVPFRVLCLLLHLILVFTSRPNVLYILSDDMNAELGVFGGPAITPNLDKLASEGLAFPRAFCQISVCSPSRQSFLTSRRPDTNRVWNFIDANPLNTSAIPGYFRDAGYLTLGLGKTFHEAAGGWNAPAYWNTTFLPYFPYDGNVCPHGGEGGGHCTLPDEDIWDFKLLNATLRYLEAAATHTRDTGAPFFLMTGFRDPHAPWAAPPRMAALYDEGSIAPAAQQTLGNGTPLIAWSNQLAVMLSNGTTFPFGPYSPVPLWVARDQRHAYMAAISYVDEHVGQLVAKLESEGLADNTIIVFHSDHGYSTGQHGYWEKKANFESIVRVPLIVKVPSKGGSAGQKAATFIDLVDIFPTLAKLAGIPPPPGVDGDDLSAAFDAPGTAQKSAAYHQYPACNMKAFNETRGACNNVPREQFDYMSYSVRTPEWRYTLWLAWDKANLVALWDGAFEEELYAHAGDDGTSLELWDNENLAAANPAMATQLRAQLRAFFRKQ